MIDALTVRVVRDGHEDLGEYVYHFSWYLIPKKRREKEAVV